MERRGIGKVLFLFRFRLGGLVLAIGCSHEPKHGLLSSKMERMAVALGGTLCVMLGLTIILLSQRLNVLSLTVGAGCMLLGWLFSRKLRQND